MRTLLLLIGTLACRSPKPAVWLEVEPAPESPLAALAHVDVEVVASVHIELQSDAVCLRTPTSDAATSHRLAVPGMRAETTYALTAVATLADGSQARSEPVPFTTSALPLVPPPFTAGGDAEGITLLGMSPPRDSDASFRPWLFGVDADGEVVWWYDPEELADSPTVDRFARLRDDGTVLVRTHEGFHIVDATSERLDSAVVEDLGVPRFHHDVIQLDDGGIAGLVRTFDERTVPPWPDPVMVIADAVVEVSGQGEVWSWNTLDHLDPDRWPTELSQTLNANGRADWTHANSLVAVDGLYVVSLRHQNQVIAIDRATGTLAWTFGADGDFELLEGTWFTGPHNASLHGTELWLFDNANDSADSTSRAVRYALDFEARTARQIWQWRSGIHVDTNGDVDELADGHVLVVAGGARPDGDDGRIVELVGDQVVWELSLQEDWRAYRAERVDWVRDCE